MDYIKIGKIVNTHGIKGELSIAPLTSDNDRFYELEKLYLGDNKVELEIEGIRPHKNVLLIKFKDFTNINQVLDYVGDSLYIHEVQKKVLPKNNYFISDVIGCEVFNTENEKIGIVTEVNQFASNDIFIISNKEKNKEYMIPARKEFFVDIDVEKKKIAIDPIEGLIE